MELSKESTFNNQDSYSYQFMNFKPLIASSSFVSLTSAFHKISSLLSIWRENSKGFGINPKRATKLTWFSQLGKGVNHLLLNYKYHSCCNVQYLPVRNQLQEKQTHTRWCFFFYHKDELPAQEKHWKLCRGSYVNANIKLNKTCIKSMLYILV